MIVNVRKVTPVPWFLQDLAPQVEPEPVEHRRNRAYEDVTIEVPRSDPRGMLQYCLVLVFESLSFFSRLNFRMYVTRDFEIRPRWQMLRVNHRSCDRFLFMFMCLDVQTHLHPSPPLLLSFPPQ